MPLPNEHSCRILDPAGFQKGSFRRIKESSAGKTLWMITGLKTLSSKCPWLSATVMVT